MGKESPYRRSRSRLAMAGMMFLLALTWGACQSIPQPGAPAPSGALRLQSTPSGATITLDGSGTRLRTPATLPDLAAGEHQVELSHSGYRPWEKTFLLKPGETLSFDVRLPPSATGTFSISSVPFQCRIFVDGRPVALMTPATLDDLPVGTHTILLKREGYEDWSQAIVVLKNRHLHLKASLKPARGLTGHFRIQSYPPDATIVLDGYPTGNRTPATLYNLQAGVHQLLLAKEGYHDWSEDIVVREGQTEALLVILPRSHPSMLGSAAIHSVPSGAEVILDDVALRNRTPVLLKSVTRGRHSLRVEKENFSPWEGELMVQPGERTDLSITLSPR